MANNKSIYQTKIDIEQIKVRMSNLANRSTRAALRALRTETDSVLDLAMKFAPYDPNKKGPHLQDRDSWKIDESRTGINGRYEMIIKMRNGRWFIRNGRRITLGMYAELMHNGWGSHRPYNLRKGSRDKASALGLASRPVPGGKYVGWLYLSRAINVRRAITNQKLKEAVRSVYQ